MQTTLSKEVINPHNVHQIGLRIKKVWSGFDLKGFEKEVTLILPSQNLGERIQQVRVSLENFLPKNYQRSLKIILKALPPPLDATSLDKLDLASLNGFIMISLTSFVARNGLDEFEISMSALKEMTSRFSSEGSIRYFIQKYPTECLELFQTWAEDPSPHVRRLVSEGTRPRLPMSIALADFKKDPRPVLKLLDKLKSDPELFVRRSVANNLNDIAKDNPELVVATLGKWNKVKSPERQWLIKHALRTLEKQGHPGALEILGFSTRIKVSVEKFQLAKKTIQMGDSLDIQLRLSSSAKKVQPLLVDYIVYHQKANGSLSPKVFKWKKTQMVPGEDMELHKTHQIKTISTRKYYPGRHEIHLQVNGVVMAKTHFNLKKS